MARVIKILILVVCVALLAVGAFQIATAQPKGIPNTASSSTEQPLDRFSTFLQSDQALEIREALRIGLPATPATWFGLVSSLAGTLIFWMSVMIMARRKRA